MNHEWLDTATQIVHLQNGTSIKPGTKFIIKTRGKIVQVYELEDAIKQQFGAKSRGYTNQSVFKFEQLNKSVIHQYTRQIFLIQTQYTQGIED